MKKETELNSEVNKANAPTTERKPTYSAPDFEKHKPLESVGQTFYYYYYYY
jgi:hypothetical protein